MTPSAWIYGQLKRFRAGLGSGISYLARCFGLDRYRSTRYMSRHVNTLRSIAAFSYYYSNHWIVFVTPLRLGSHRASSAGVWWSGPHEVVGRGRRAAVLLPLVRVTC